MKNAYSNCESRGRGKGQGERISTRKIFMNQMSRDICNVESHMHKSVTRNIAGTSAKSVEVELGF